MTEIAGGAIVLSDIADRLKLALTARPPWRNISRICGRPWMMIGGRLGIHFAVEPRNLLVADKTDYR
jgi:hypothetical protein